MKLESISYPQENVCRMVFSADAAEFEAGIQQAWQKAYDAHKCMVSREQAEEKQGEQTFWYDAINAVMAEKLPPAYREAQKQAGIHPVALPIYQLVEVSKEKGFTAAAVASLCPKLTMKPYTNLEQSYKADPVTEKDIEDAVSRLQARFPILQEHDGPAVMGDTVVIDFSGTVEGKPFRRGSAENYMLRLGGKTTLEGFEEGICGHTAGEEFTMQVKFPPVFHTSENLAGKTADFRVKLYRVGVSRLPEADDAFAKRAGGFDTMDALRADIRKKLESRSQEKAIRQAREQLLNQLSGLAEGALPQPLVEREYHRQMDELALSLQLQQSSMDVLLKQTGLSKEEMEKRVLRHAEDICRRDMALLNIAEQEKLAPNDAELQQEIAKRAAEHKSSVEDFLKTVDENLMMQSILSHRAENFVIEHARILEAK
jgi:trigger factor